jgi:adenylate kinase
LHHPFTEADYPKRAASKEMMRIKLIEDEVLNFKKEGVKTFVISSGVLYGQGEEVFNSHFKKAWL